MNRKLNARDIFLAMVSHDLRTMLRIWAESAVGAGSTFFFTLPQGLAPPGAFPVGLGQT